MSINREATIRWKGYDPDMLSHGSNKRVWTNCDDCGNGRWVIYNQYRPLCNSCSHKNISPSEETKKKLSESKMGIKNPMFGNHHSEKTKKRIRDMTSGENSPNYGKHRTDATKKKISESRIGKYGGENNPNYGKHPSEETLKKMRCERPSISGKNNPNYGRGLFGEFNGNWRGGISFEPYCQEFNGRLKQQIRDQYGNCDFLSGLPDFICNIINNTIYKLDVHHVDSNKNQGCDDVKWKLVPLSRKNHARMNGNAMFWEKLICYALEYDETYYNKEQINLMESN